MTNPVTEPTAGPTTFTNLWSTHLNSPSSLPCSVRDRNPGGARMPVRRRRAGCPLEGLALVLVMLLVAPAAATKPLLTGVVPDLPERMGDGGFRISSSDANQRADLTGYLVTDGKKSWSLPAVGVDADGAWFVANTSRWQAYGMPNATRYAALKLGNDAGLLRLVDPSGGDTDAVAWGTRTEPGMTGTLPAQGAGTVYERLRTAPSWTDTDRAADWQTPRVHQVGESRLGAPSWTVPTVTLYASPDSSYGVLLRLIQNATTRLALHVYEFTSLALGDAVVAAQHAHPRLQVAVLVDGAPVGLDAADRRAEAENLARIQAAGGSVVLAGTGRYQHHHLKVLVADDAVAVQSENWVASGVPAAPSWGNRGWGAVLWDERAAHWFDEALAADRLAWDSQAFDLASFDPGHRPPAREPARAGPYGPPVAALDLHGVDVQAVLAPDATTPMPGAAGSLPGDPIGNLLAGATHTVDAQQLDLRTGARNTLGWSGPDALGDGLHSAALRSVAVRAMAAPPFAADDEGNRATLAWLTQAGAATAEGQRPGIATWHNKGLLVDGEAVVLGSLNGNQASRSANREADLILRDRRAAAYFGALFEGDWQASHGQGAAPTRDWSVPGRDLKGLPAAPLPTLFVVLWVACLLARRR